MKCVQAKKAGVLLPPRAKLKVDCEPLFTPFRTVIGGPFVGSGIYHLQGNFATYPAQLLNKLLHQFVSFDLSR